MFPIYLKSVFTIWRGWGRPPHCRKSKYHWIFSYFEHIHIIIQSKHKRTHKNVYTIVLFAGLGGNWMATSCVNMVKRRKEKKNSPSTCFCVKTTEFLYVANCFFFNFTNISKAREMVNTILFEFWADFFL